MKKYIIGALTSSIIASNIYAIDVKFGKGDFSFDMGLKNIMKTSVDISTNVISISEHNYQISDSSFYLFGNLDIYSSDEVDGFTDFIDQGMQQNIPMLNQTPNEIMGNFVPVPSSYKMKGIDLDIGVGYSLLRDKKSFFGIGFATGLSTPFIEMENYIEAGKFFLDGLEKTDTDIMTYKMAISLQGSYNFMENLGIYTTLIYGYQKADIENDIIKSSMDSSGTYTSFDFGIKYSLTQIVSNLYVTLGHTSKKWDIDEINAEIMGVKGINPASIFDMSLESKYSYLSVGYQF